MPESPTTFCLFFLINRSGVALLNRCFSLKLCEMTQIEETETLWAVTRQSNQKGTMRTCRTCGDHHFYA